MGEGKSPTVGRRRTPCKYYKITETDRNAIIESFTEHIPSIVYGMNLRSEGLTSDDFISEAYVALVEAVDSYDATDPACDGTTLEQWVIRRIRFRLIDKQRYYSAKKRSIGQGSPEICYDEVLDTASVRVFDIDDICVWDMIEDLPEFQKDVMTLFYRDGLTEREIADIYDVSVHKVHYHRAIALKRLRQASE